MKLLAILFFMLFTVLAGTMAQASEEIDLDTDESILLPFSSNGCTASPEGKEERNWGHCCVIHDAYYWMGGPRTERVKADEIFKTCLTESASKTRAKIYYGMVRAFGSPKYYSGWGRGRKMRGHYDELSTEQLEIRQNLLDYLSEIEDLKKLIGVPVEPEIFIIQD